MKPYAIIQLYAQIINKNTHRMRTTELKDKNTIHTHRTVPRSTFSKRIHIIRYIHKYDTYDTYIPVYI